MFDLLEMKRRRLNLKEYALVILFFLVCFLFYYHLTQFKSYVKRSEVTPRIVKHCSKYKQNLNQDRSRLRRRVGFFLIGTGKYIKFAQQLIDSMEKHFCSYSPHIYVHYFIFTDDKSFVPKLLSDDNRNFSNIFQEHLQWPMSTLLRFENILKNAKKVDFFGSFDYLYWLDGDMRMVDDICEDIFGDLVGTMHPHYYKSNQKYPYESSNQKSRAYLEQDHRYENPYYVGAFYGGNAEEMCKLLMTCDENIQWDYKSLDGFIAKVHDESHLNRYFVDHHPTLVLSRAYCYSEPPEDENYPWLKMEHKQKIHALRKNKAFVRSDTTRFFSSSFSSCLIFFCSILRYLFV